MNIFLHPQDKYYCIDFLLCQIFPNLHNRTQSKYKNNVTCQLHTALNHMKQLDTLTYYLLNDSFNNILSSVPRFLSGLLVL